MNTLPNWPKPSSVRRQSLREADHQLGRVKVSSFCENFRCNWDVPCYGWGLGFLGLTYVYRQFTHGFPAIKKMKNLLRLNHPRDQQQCKEGDQCDPSNWNVGSKPQGVSTDFINSLESNSLRIFNSWSNGKKHGPVVVCLGFVYKGMK